MNTSRNKLIILITVFIDIIGIGIIIPVIPFYVKSFGVSEITVTWLFAIYSFLSLFSTPFLGGLSDKIGRRPILLASLATTCVGWLIFAMAGNIWMLFLGRAIDGLAAGNISTAQSYLVDISATPKERTANLGLIGMIFGLGLIIGPLLGGLLGTIQLALPFYVVGVMAGINTLLAFKFLPETLKTKSNQKLSLNPLTPFVKGLKNRLLRPSLLAFFIFGMAISIQQSIFALYLDKGYNWNELHSGIIFAAMGLLLAINQGVLIRQFWIKKFKEPDLEQYLFLGLAAGFATLGVINITALILGLLLVTLSQSVLRVVMVSQMAGNNLKDQGAILGISNSIMSLSMIIGPIIAGPLFALNICAPYWSAAILAIAGFIVITAKRKLLAKIQLSPKTEILIPQ
jgi:DHA1 family tetracycline resistance protein-like MFS transporter